MKYFKIIIVLLSFSNIILGQDVDSIREVQLEEKQNKILTELILVLEKDNFKIKDLEDFCLSKKNKDDNYFDQRELFIRKLEDGLLQYYFEINNLFTAFYSLVILEIENEIIYLRLYTEKEVLFERKTEYSSSFSNPIQFPLEVYDYGVGCGIVGEIPEYCGKMMDLVSRNDYGRLTDWLNSKNPEIIAYGYMGLYFLSKRGIEIKESEIDRMKRVESMPIELYTCEGCLYGGMKKTGDAVRKEKLDHNYELLQGVYKPTKSSEELLRVLNKVNKNHT